MISNGSLTKSVGAPAGAETTSESSPAAGRLRRRAIALGIGVSWVVLSALAVLYVGGLAVRGVALGVTLLPRAIVWMFLAAQDGADWWSIAGRAGAAAAATLTSSQVLWWLIGLELLGVAALIGLRTMLREEIRGRDAGEGKQ